MAEKRTVELNKRKHPLYDDNIDLWDLYYSAAKGGTNFITESNLFTHRLELTDDYEERLLRGYFLNFCESIPQLYNTFIMKEPVIRPGDESLTTFREDVDRTGKGITDFIKRAGFLASVFGVVHAIVDIPQSPKKVMSKRDVKDNKIRPYATLILPTQLKDWSLDAFGNFRWVVIEYIYYRDMDPTAERETEKHYKLITNDEWRVEDEQGQPVKYEDGTPNKGKNNLGFVPIVTMYNRNIENNKIGESMLKDIVYINRAIFNWCSCIDEQIERQTFSQLVVPDDGTLTDEEESTGDPLVKIGTSHIYTFPATSNHPPAFISPNVTNLTSVWSLVMDHVKEIYRLAGLIGSSDDMYIGRSGRAAQIGFVGVNSALAEKAKLYQDFENEISKLAYTQLGKNQEEFQAVKYSESFDVAALSTEIDMLFKILERNFSETLNVTLIKNIARKVTTSTPDSIRTEIEKEIEVNGGRVEPLSNGQERTTSDIEDKDEGPKDTLVSKTNMSKEDADYQKSAHRKPKTETSGS